MQKDYITAMDSPIESLQQTHIYADEVEALVAESDNIRASWHRTTSSFRRDVKHVEPYLRISAPSKKMDPMMKWPTVRARTRRKRKKRKKKAGTTTALDMFVNDLGRQIKEIKAAHGRMEKELVWPGVVEPKKCGAWGTLLRKKRFENGNDDGQSIWQGKSKDNAELRMIPVKKETVLTGQRDKPKRKFTMFGTFIMIAIAYFVFEGWGLEES